MTEPFGTLIEDGVIHTKHGIMNGHNYTNKNVKKEWIIKYLRNSGNTDIKVNYILSDFPNNPNRDTIDIPKVHFAVATKSEDKLKVRAYGCNGGGRSTIGNGRLTFDITKVTCSNCLSSLTAGAKRV